MEPVSIIKKLNKAGFLAYFVGGCVRDRLLGLPVKDEDVTTNAAPSQVLEICGGKQVFSHSGAPVVVVGGTEVASFRSDSGARGDGETFQPATLQEDSARRDFTINALYQHMDGEILDPTGQGLEDLKNGVVRFVGNAETRIKEDPTRILRAFRFAHQKHMGFANGTAQALQAKGGMIETLPQEQIGREMVKIMGGFMPEGCLRTMLDSGVLRFAFPELFALVGVEQNAHHAEGDSFEHTMLVLRHSKKGIVNRLAAVCHDLGKALTQEPKPSGGYSFHGHAEVSAELADRVLRKWGSVSRQERERVAWLCENHMRTHNLQDMSRGKAMRLLRHDGGKELLSLCEADIMGRLPVSVDRWIEVRDTAERLLSEDRTLEDLGINGGLLVSLGQSPGRALGAKLQMMTALLDKDPKLTREELLEKVGFR